MATRLGIITLLIFISNNALSAEYQMDFNYRSVENRWQTGTVAVPRADAARFNKNMTGIGGTWWAHGSIGYRASYSNGGDAFTSGKYEDYTQDMKSVATAAVMWKYDLNDQWRVYTGLTLSYLPIPIRNDETGFYKWDNDDDAGFLFGIEYRVGNWVSLGLKHDQLSTIKHPLQNGHGRLDESTRSTEFQVIFNF